MILGRYSADLPRVHLRIRGPAGPIALEFVVDTGFDGHLVLPSPVLFKLGSRADDLTARRLGDGRVTDCNRHYIEVEWNDSWRVVEALELGSVPLLGTLMMEGGSLHIELFEGGEVVLDLPD